MLSLVIAGSWPLAHGGTAGLIVELAPLALLGLLGIVVWRRSRSSVDRETEAVDPAHED